MARDSKVTIKTIEKAITDNDLTDNVGYSFKRGKILMNFMLREAERTEFKEECEYDVSEYTVADLQKLVSNYHAYINFGV
jgi:hypothetical protein